MADISRPNRSTQQASKSEVDTGKRRYRTLDANPTLIKVLRYAKRDWEIFPLHERIGDGGKDDICGCGDAKCRNQGKHPIGTLAPHGFKDATTDPDTLKEWWRQNPKAGIGLATGRPSGIIVIDVDQKNGKDGANSLRELEAKLGPLPDTKTATTPSDGLHKYYNDPTDIDSGTDKLGPGVDVKADGGYVVMPPSHGLYRWIDRGPVADLPAAWIDHLRNPPRVNKVKKTHTAKASLTEIEAALAAVNNDASVSRDEWINIGLAVHHGSDGSEEGFALFDCWSRRYPQYDDAETRKAWDSFDPREITVASLFYQASQANPSWRVGLVQDGRVVLSKDIPMESAQAFAKHMIDDDRSHLRFYRGAWYRWVGTHYSSVDPKALRTEIYAFLQTKGAVIDKKSGAVVPFNPRPANVNEIIDCLEAGVHEQLRMTEREAPYWIAGSVNEMRDASAIIACRNGLLDLKTGALLPHDPQFFNVNCLSFDYDPNAKCPRFNQFLKELWPGDQGLTKRRKARERDDKRARLLLGELFGLMLTPDTSFHKIFMLVGPGRSGKGTIARVLEGLIGKPNVGAPSMSQLTTQFGLQDLIDKRLAVVGDARLGKNTDRITERLLSISGGDKQQIDIKYRSPWTGTMCLRFLILTNELPRIPDASATLPTRFVLLKLEKSFKDNPDIHLTDKLTAELPGILNWALRGLVRLRKRGYFEMPQTSLDAMQTLEDLASPVRSFVRDRCEVQEGSGPTLRVGVKELWGAYRAWCGREGQEAGTSTLFGRNLKACCPNVTTAGRNPDRFYRGLCLRTEASE